jgi:invasion protein IalB
MRRVAAATRSRIKVMSIRLPLFFSAALPATVMATAALAQAPAAAPAPAAAAQRDPNAPVLTETHQDWTLRCFNVRGPAPCDMQQMAANRQRQRVLSVSLAYIPQNDRYALQVVVPLGIAIAKGMTLNAGDKTLRGVRFNRCSRDGCFVELIVDAATVDALSKVGAQTLIIVFPYGQTKDVKLPLSLKGFVPALARLKVVARERHVPSRQPAAPRPGAPAAPAPAAPAPAAPAPAPSP